MQPQQPNNPLPPEQYNFILNNAPKPRRRLNLPLPNLPKPAKVLLLVMGVILIVLVFAALIFGGRSGNSQPLVDVLARSQEIIRITDIAAPQALDSGTKAVAATAKNSLTSDQAALNSFLAGSGEKIEPQTLTAYQDADTESRLQAAASNGELDEAYAAYLKDALTNYSSALQAAYQTAPPAAQPLLEEAFESVQVILSSPNL
jgi:hypothetical protein